MQPLGFIHSMMEVKVLILFVLARANYPATCQQIYEMCYQDDCLSYFDVCTAIPQLVSSGHIGAAEGEKAEDEKYVITTKGRENLEQTQDAVAYTVRNRAEDAVAAFNRQCRRSGLVKTALTPLENGEYTVGVTLSDEQGLLMKLELIAPDRRQAVRLERLLDAKAETVYGLAMTELLNDEDSLDE